MDYLNIQGLKSPNSAAASYIVTSRQSFSFSSWLQVASQSYFSPVSHIFIHDWRWGLAAWEERGLCGHDRYQNSTELRT